MEDLLYSEGQQQKLESVNKKDTEWMWQNQIRIKSYQESKQENHLGISHDCLMWTFWV